MITIKVTSNTGLEALKALEEKKQIEIISEIDYNSPSLPGPAMSKQEFKD